MEDGSKEGKMTGEQYSQGFNVKVQAGRDGGLCWAAAVGVERKTAVQGHRFTLWGLTGCGPQEEVVIYSRRGCPGGGTSLKRAITLSHCTEPISI